MNRPIESDYTSLTAYTRSLEEYCDGLVQPAPVQEPVAWSSYEYDGIHHKPVAWMDRDGNFSDNNDHRCFPIPLYTITHPPQPEERNFCPRCGKRTADLTVIHTCTPPQENT